MKPIYNPKGAAKEYGDLAINIYKGCPHRCYYCFAPNVLRREKEVFHNNTEPRENIVEETVAQLRRENITGKRTASYAAKLKRMGLQPGFPDIFIPLARKGYHGLFIELKVGNNKPSREQKDWLTRLSSERYATAVAWGFDDAKKNIDKYLDTR